MKKVYLIAEQLTLDGGPEYVVYWTDGTSKTFQDYPTEDQLNGNVE